VTVKCRKTIKALFLYFYLRLSLMLGDLSRPFTSMFYLINTRKSTENSAFVFNVIKGKLKMKNI
jgi:hypothetical protein